MNLITHWNPLRELEDMQHRIMRAMHLPGTPRNGEEEAALSASRWSPLADISESDHEYVIHFEIADVDKKDVHVTVDNGVLTVRGERKFEQKDRKFHRIERSFGSFSRSMSMPDDADASKVSAEFRNGVLTVRIAKAESAKPRQIEVKVD